jgi:pyruvate formate lyase activating enzyme
MQISGLIKQSLMDYPGKIAAVIFTQGCNMNCPYCHNQELIPFTPGIIPENLIFAHLNKNKELLDGVVITGGEPTLQKDLPEFITRIKKETNLAIKLDTNGSNPLTLQQLISEGLIDYIAMDVKADLTKQNYALNSGKHYSSAGLLKIKHSIRLIIRSGKKHEFRTTICQELLSFNDIKLLYNRLEGAHAYYMQTYHTVLKDDANLSYSPYPNEEMACIKSQLKGKVPVFIRQ